MASAASYALYQDVFKDGPLGNFDTKPELTSGCSMGIGCTVLTPYAIVGADVYYASVDNLPRLACVNQALSPAPV
jgi:hypothetical protein